MKNGHLTIQFPPAFAGTPVDVWSWGANPVNISCLAESIPNATITWRLNDREVERDPNVYKFSSGPQSVLRVSEDVSFPHIIGVLSSMPFYDI